MIVAVQEKLPPTDSRLRPDQRHLESGEFDAANSEKLRLEQKQRRVSGAEICFCFFWSEDYTCLDEGVCCKGFCCLSHYVVVSLVCIFFPYFVLVVSMVQFVMNGDHYMGQYVHMSLYSLPCILHNIILDN